MAFDKGGAERVTRLYRRDDLPENRMLAARTGLVSGLPPDAPDILHSGSAWVEGAAALSDLCFPSKAVWGYDP